MMEKHTRRERIRQWQINWVVKSRTKEEREERRERGQEDTTPSECEGERVGAESVRRERERESGMAEANKQFSFFFLTFHIHYRTLFLR